jgi:hypothetical protein
MVKLSLIFLVFALILPCLAAWRRCGSTDTTKKICKTSMHRCNWNLRDMCDVGKEISITNLDFLEACQGEGITESLSCDKAGNKAMGVNIKVLIEVVKKGLAAVGSYASK